MNKWTSKQTDKQTNKQANKQTKANNSITAKAQQQQERR